MSIPDYTILGAGVFGLTAALELAERGHSVEVLSAGPIPDPAAASADISKIVRMEYGSDAFYMHVVDRCIDKWHQWNKAADAILYHETGFLLLCSQSMDDPRQAFEKASYTCLLENGKSPVRLTSTDIANRFPMFNHETYVDGFYHDRAGWAHASAVLKFLSHRCEKAGVQIKAGTRIVDLVTTSQHIEAIVDDANEEYRVNEVVVCAGSFTPRLLKGYTEIFTPTGHPVFHLKPGQDPSLLPPQFPVFAADISNTGWYGFPLHPTANVVKVANHGTGLHRPPPITEDRDDPSDRALLDEFLKKGIPELHNAPCTYKRYCYYSDTPDGHFWIDRDQEFGNLTVAAGGSGHAFKMAPVLGQWIADAANLNLEQVPARFRRRPFDASTGNQEEARSK